jgi:hypothetical protein
MAKNNRDSINKSIERFIGIEDHIESELDKLDDENEDQDRERFEIVQYEPVESKVPAEQRDSDLYDDYQYTRTILRGLIERGTGALEGSLMLAKESEHPRAFEVSSALMKNISDMSKDLMALHKHMEDGGSQQSGAKTVNNTQNNYYTDGSGKQPKGVDDLLDDLDDNEKQ